MAVLKCSRLRYPWAIFLIVWILELSPSAAALVIRAAEK